MQAGGLKTKNLSKKHITKLPLLSIITVVRNGEDLLEGTILSILGQDYPNIEYIIIDGASSDKTLEIIKKYEDFIDYWISDCDKGIYDAMNKGISLASGDWVNFMNAGDEFNNNSVCKLVVETVLHIKCNIIYGDVLAKDSIIKSEIILHAKPLQQIWKGMVFSHQSVFILRSDLLNNLFDLKYKLASDFNQIVTFYIQQKKFFYLPIIISNVTIGGLSYSSTRTIREQIMIIHSCRPFSPSILYLILLLFITKFKTIIGTKTILKIRRVRWKIMNRKKS